MKCILVLYSRYKCPYKCSIELQDKRLWEWYTVNCSMFECFPFSFPKALAQHEGKDPSEFEAASSEAAALLQQTPGVDQRQLISPPIRPTPAPPTRGQNGGVIKAGYS